MVGLPKGSYREFYVNIGPIDFFQKKKTRFCFFTMLYLVGEVVVMVVVVVVVGGRWSVVGGRWSVVGGRWSVVVVVVVVVIFSTV